MGSFTSPVTYTVGEKVKYDGKNYQVIQTHNNYGDLSWAPSAHSTLFKEIK